MTTTHITIPFAGEFSFDDLADQILESLNKPHPWPWVPFQVSTYEIGPGRFVALCETEEPDGLVEAHDFSLVAPIDDELPEKLEVGGVFTFDLLWSDWQEAAVAAARRIALDVDLCRGVRNCERCQLAYL